VVKAVSTAVKAAFDIAQESHKLAISVSSRIPGTVVETPVFLNGATVAILRTTFVAAASDKQGFIGAGGLGEAPNSLQTNTSTNYWQTLPHQDLSKRTTGTDPDLDAYLADLKDPKSSTHEAVDQNRVNRPTPTKIWEVGVVTAIKAGKVVGNVAIQGPGPNGEILLSTIDTAFRSMKSNVAGFSRVIYHDHSEYGSVMTDSDMTAGAALHSVVIARQGDVLMMYVPSSSGRPAELWQGKFSDFNLK
jgi:hypothetical protein